MRYEIDPTPPTLQTFLHALHFTNKEQVSSREIRLEKVAEFERKHAIELPLLLRALFERQDGGHTEFQYVPIVANPPYVFEGPAAAKAFDSAWMAAFPDNDLYPLDHIHTIGWHSDQIEFGEEGWSWRNRVTECDRLLAINSHGSDFFLCLDYRERRHEPKVIFLSANDEDDAFDIDVEFDNFEDFFQSTRRMIW